MSSSSGEILLSSLTKSHCSMSISSSWLSVKDEFRSCLGGFDSERPSSKTISSSFDRTIDCWGSFWSYISISSASFSFPPLSFKSCCDSAFIASSAPLTSSTGSVFVLDRKYDRRFWRISWTSLSFDSRS